MKKIILVLLMLLLGGCYDYCELTDLGIVSSVIIDYKDDEYFVNLEMLKAKEDASEPSYFLEGRGKTFESALFDIYNKSTKKVYFNHINTVIVSESIANDKLLNIYDYFLIDPDVSKDSYFVICDEIDKLLEFKNEDKLSIGETIKDVIHYNEEDNSNFVATKFNDIIHSYLNKTNYLLSSIVINKNAITLSDTYVISDNKLKLKLDNNAILFANLLKNSTESFNLINEDVYEVYNYKVDTKVEKEKINISFDGDVRLFGSISIDSSNKEKLENIEKSISENLEKYILNCIDYSKNNNIDIYNFDQIYYKYQPKNYKKEIWKNLDYDVSVNVELNEKGLILNQIGDGMHEK